MKLLLFIAITSIFFMQKNPLYADTVSIKNLEVSASDKHFILQVEKAFNEGDVEWLLRNTHCLQEYKTWGADLVPCVDLAEYLYTEAVSEGVEDVIVLRNGEGGITLVDDFDNIIYNLTVVTENSTSIMAISKFDNELFLSM